MDSLDLCLPKALAELNLLEQYKLNTLVHKWRDVVGDVIAEHTKIVSIKPPDMVISADNSMWMQELQMQKRRIIEAINKYYHQEVITDIHDFKDLKSVQFISCEGGQVQYGQP